MAKRIETKAELEARLKTMQAFIPESLAEKIRKGKGQIEGERRFVTVMFSDVSGFTAMSELLDPEEVTSTMNDCYQVLSEIVYKYEGMIDKFIGDCIMVIFGSPVSHENDPERAVRCALDMQEVMKRFNRGIKPTNIDLSLHIGVNSGWVIAGAVGSDLRMDYTVIGDTVNLASRLESAAEKGKIYISQRTAALVKGIIELHELKPLRLKGKRKPVVTYEVLGLKKRPRPVRGLVIRSEMVGREKEFALLKKRLQDVKKSKKGRMLFITGEAGIGKSRLSEEFGRYALKKGFLWIQGCCLSYGKTVSYGVFLEMLRSIFGIWEMEKPEEKRNQIKARMIKKLFAQRFDEVYPYILRLLSLEVEEEYQVKVKHLDAKALRLAQFCAVRDLFVALSQKKPVVFVFEDWHWADVSSVELFEFLLNSVDRSAMLLLVMMRPDKGSTGFRVMEKAKKRLKDLVNVVLLGQLEKEESEQLIKNLISGIPEALQKLILTRSKGNPFFVEEIIRSLIDSDILIFKSDVWHLISDIGEIEIPDRIELLIGSRIDLLTSEVRYILQAASAIGLCFFRSVLQYITQVVESELNVYLNRLEEREFVLKKLSTLNSKVLTNLEFLFKHPLIQEVAYDGLLKKKRKEFHLKVGESIEEIFKDRIEDYYGILAHHYYYADILEKSYDYYKIAGDKAKELYKNDASIEFYTMAIGIHKRIFPENKKESMGELFEKRGDVQVIKAGYENALKDYKNAFDYYIDIEKKARIKRKTGNIFREKCEYETAISLHKEAKEMLKSKSESTVLSETLIDCAFLFSEGKSDYERAEKMIEEALRKIDEKKEPRIYAQGLNNLGGISLRRGDHNKALKYYQRSLRINEELNNKMGIGTVSGNIGIVYRVRGEFDIALKYYQRYLAIAEEIGDKKGVGRAFNGIGVVHMEKGELETTLNYYKRYLAISEEIGDKRGIGQVYDNIGSVYYIKGELDTALKYYKKSLAIYEEIDDKRGIGVVSNNIGLVHHEKGELNIALKYYKKSLAIYEQIDDKGGIGVVSNNIGDIYYKKGELDTALKYFNICLTISEEIGNKRAIGAASAGIGVIYHTKGKLNAALKYYKRELAIAEEIGNKGKIGTACINIGSVYMEIKMFDDARAYLEKGERILVAEGDRIKISEVYINLAELNTLQENYEEALKFEKKALSFAKETGAKEKDLHSLRTMGKVLSKKNPERAISYLEQSISLAQKENRKLELAISLYELAKIMLKTGNNIVVALQNLEEAEIIFKKSGAKLWLNKVEQLRRKQGILQKPLMK